MSFVNTKPIRQFLKPDKRRILLFLTIPFLLYLIIFVLGPHISGPYVYLGIIPGAILLMTLFPFSLAISLFRAIGIDPFYTTGIASKIVIITGIVLTVVWWYILSCMIAYAVSRIKPKSAVGRT